MSNKSLWAGRIVTALVALFLLFDGVVHIMQIPAVVQAFAQMGYPQGVMVPVAVVELISVVLYVIPSTSVFGAISEPISRMAHPRP
jgi:hypothetical protein